jgi:hypothetical protein
MSYDINPFEERHKIYNDFFAANTQADLVTLSHTYAQAFMVRTDHRGCNNRLHLMKPKI